MSRKKIHPATRTLFLLVLGLVLVNGGLCLVLRTPPRETVLGHTAAFLHRQAGDDSWTPMKKALDYLRSGAPGLLYQTIFFTEKVKFQYPPTSLFAARPSLKSLNRISWLAVWVLAGFVILIFQASPRQSPAGEVDAPSWGNAVGAGLLWLCLTVTFYPVVKGYSLGQVQVWINTLFAAAFWAWLTGRRTLAGLLLGGICLLKPHYALLGLWGLLRRQWGFVSALAGTALAGCVVSVALYGLGNHLDYLRVLSYLSRHGEGFYPNQSVNGLLNRLLFNGNNLEWEGHAFPPFHPWVYAGTLTSSLVLLGLVLFAPVRPGQKGSALDFALMALAGTLASPVAWEHHYGVLLPIYAYLVPVLARRGGPGCWLLCLSYLLTANFLVFTNRLASTPWNFVQSYLLAGALLLLVLLFRLRSPAGDRHSGQTEGVEQSPILVCVPAASSVDSERGAC